MPQSENMRVMCPNLTCRKILAVPVSARGKTVRCRGCGTNIRIPKEEVPAAPAGPNANAASSS
ncbi:MAG: hypothetical protein JNM80_05150 [Phycisphaerae bacterium]|nr:hypothetical protein [Phycisphaerae bacterium]